MAKTKEEIVKEARERISKLESSGGFVWTAKDQVLFTHLCDIANQGSDGWISCESGELPEGVTSFKTMSEYVQVWVEGKHPNETGIGHGRYCHDRKQWFVTLVNFHTPENPLVTHYRPLPSPPPQSQSK